jgi:hypothetical protein
MPPFRQGGRLRRVCVRVQHIEGVSASCFGCIRDPIDWTRQQLSDGFGSRLPQRFARSANQRVAHGARVSKASDMFALRDAAPACQLSWQHAARADTRALANSSLDTV